MFRGATGKGIVAAGLIALGSIGLVPQTAGASTTASGFTSAPYVQGAFDSAAEADFLARTNAARAAAGVGPLSVDGRLVGPARQWSTELAAAGGLSHRSNSRLAAEAPAEWMVLGENVGYGPSVASIHEALLHSPTHYANIVDARYSVIGMGVYVDDSGRIWVTEYFMATGGSAPAPEEPAPAPAPSGSSSGRTKTAAPAVETTTTTTTTPPTPRLGGAWSPRRGGPHR